MNGKILDDVLWHGARTLFLVVTPFVAGISLAALLTAVLQAATSVQEPATLYAIKVVTLVVLLYFFLPVASRSLVTLAEIAFR